MSEEKFYGLNWICYICGKYYEHEHEARQCTDTHDYYEYIPQNAIGKDMPIRIKVSLFRKNKLNNVKFYIPEE